MTYILHKRQHPLWLRTFFEQAFVGPVVLEFITMKEAQRTRRQLYRFRNVMRHRDAVRAARYELVTMEIAQPSRYKITLTGRTYRSPDK